MRRCQCNKRRRQKFHSIVDNLPAVKSLLFFSLSFFFFCIFFTVTTSFIFILYHQQKRPPPLSLSLSLINKLISEMFRNELLYLLGVSALEWRSLNPFVRHKSKCQCFFFMRENRCKYSRPRKKATFSRNDDFFPFNHWYSAYIIFVFICRVRTRG